MLNLDLIRTQLSEKSIYVNPQHYLMVWYALVQNLPILRAWMKNEPSNTNQVPTERSPTPPPPSPPQDQDPELQVEQSSAGSIICLLHPTYIVSYETNTYIMYLPICQDGDFLLIQVPYFSAYGFSCLSVFLSFHMSLIFCPYNSLSIFFYPVRAWV